MIAGRKRNIAAVDFTSDVVDEFYQQSSSKKAAPLLQTTDAKIEAFRTPRNANQLAELLLDIGMAKKLLASKLPLKQIRALLTGCYMRYYAVRENLKDFGHDSNFYIDKIIHVNRDGIRFKHCRDNSYRSIHKIKAPEQKIDINAFNLWINDMHNWNDPLPYSDVLSERIVLIKKTVAALPPEENTDNEKAEKELKMEDKSAVDRSMLAAVNRNELVKLVISVDELLKLIDYGRELFDQTVVGFYTQIRAPANQSIRKHQKPSSETLVYMDQIIGVSWSTKPYTMYQRPLTILLKFRHFRDERICQLPYWNKKDGISEKLYDQWLSDMQQWEEDCPTYEFIEQKANELNKILSEPPKGSVDILSIAAMEAERENSLKVLKIIRETQNRYGQPTSPVSHNTSYHQAYGMRPPGIPTLFINQPQHLPRHIGHPPNYPMSPFHQPKHWPMMPLANRIRMPPRTRLAYAPYFFNNPLHPLHHHQHSFPPYNLRALRPLQSSFSNRKMNSYCDYRSDTGYNEAVWF